MENYYHNLISCKLNTLLKRCSLTALELSQKTNIDKTKISRVINKIGMFSAPELHKIANFLKVDMSYFFVADDVSPSSIIPVIDITKEATEKQKYQFVYESDRQSPLIGIYVDKALETSLIPSSATLVVDMELEKNKARKRPLVFLYRNKLYLGLRQGKKIVNTENTQIHTASEVKILGSLEKQIVDLPKQTYADASVLETFMSKLEQVNIRYPYLYKLLAS
ncbi:MAG: helix-turn-helix transcriptional regulator [Lentisphaerae bacterium]|nr:helix-turn-helix transcriptional regulator [Lentisphaerota bacterium]